MKIRYVSLETVFPVPETWGCTDSQAISRARSLLCQRLEDNPASLMFTVETMDVADINEKPVVDIQATVDVVSEENITILQQAQKTSNRGAKLKINRQPQR